MLKLCSGALALHNERDHAEAAPVLQAGFTGMQARRLSKALQERNYNDNAITLQGVMQGRAVRMMLDPEGLTIPIDGTTHGEFLLEQTWLTEVTPSSHYSPSSSSSSAYSSSALF
jgi:hypothetical protein